MSYKTVLQSLGPCGINCSKCFAFQNGKIKEFSIRLKRELGNFDVYAQRFTKLLNKPVFELYPEFKLMLDHFSKAGCKGCRNDDCKLYADCKVKACAKKNEVDFCFQCKNFPCNSHGFDNHLKIRWLEIQTSMKEKGIENYYDEVKDLPRY